MELLTAKEAAEFLRIFGRNGTPSSTGATKFLISRGVVPLNFGKGGGRGMRFVKEEIEELLISMRPKIVPKRDKRKRKGTLPDLFSGSYKDAQKGMRKIKALNRGH